MEESKKRPLDELQRLAAMPCGLYRTHLPLASDPESVPAGILVDLHDHRPDELPYVQLPAHNDDNRWQFDPTAYDAADPDFLLSLEPLPPEGLYATLRPVPLSEDQDDVLAERSLVLLGYDRQGRCIVYPAVFSGLQIRFPAKGFLFEDHEVLGSLEAVNFDWPSSESDRVVH